MTRAERKARNARDAAPWTGPTREYDLVKEVVVALLAVTLLTMACAAVFSSPDEKPVTIAQWAQTDPHDFIMTAVSELDGSSGSATYGPPYNSASDGQKIGPISLPKLSGVQIPIDPAKDFVIDPLLLASTSKNDVQTAITTWEAATADQQAAWTAAFGTAADAATYGDDGQPALPTGDYGPVQPMLTSLMVMARSGGLDGALTTSNGFYNNDYTKSMLFLGDGGYMEEKATGQHLGGDQWGMMNEVGNYPGQAWLWLYTIWYQIEPFKSSGNADALIWGMMAVFTLVFVCVPFIPGLRRIPEKTKLYRLIWRSHYQRR